MIDFTPEERRVILFLLCIALIGTGINFAIKLAPASREFLAIDQNLAKININQATREDLVSCRCLNKKIIADILAHRLNHGPFASLEELKAIKGIGEKRYGKVKDFFYAR